VTCCPKILNLALILVAVIAISVIEPADPQKSGFSKKIMITYFFPSLIFFCVTNQPGMIQENVPHDSYQRTAFQIGFGVFYGFFLL